ncbi:MAG TPA: histidine phosphatase family protein [Longimicrobiales bacterium]|nr:histidine phosphatase family protein [Longimicrobiales bacterium]
MRRLSFLLTLFSMPAWSLMTGCATGTGDGPLADPVVVYLVRHAERAEDGTNDPPISDAGESRAHELAALLKDAGIDHVHSTDLKRTRQTGAPIVEALATPVEVYDPTDLPGFATTLRSTPGRHLVLGHSNTTPDLVAALGGTPGDAIDESEYDRLYVVVVPAKGPVSTVLLRYGARFRP